MYLPIPSSYTFDDHLHRLAVWTAARAVQRGFSVSTSLICEAFLACRIKPAIDAVASSSITADEFNALHRKLCQSLLSWLDEHGVAKVTYGRVAKILGMYIKVGYVIPTLGRSILARIAHPPIDRILLHGISSVRELPEAVSLAREKWTEWDESRYFEVINLIRRIIPGDEAFWRLECYWDAVDDEPK